MAKKGSDLTFIHVQIEFIDSYFPLFTAFKQASWKFLLVNVMYSTSMINFLLYRNGKCMSHLGVQFC